MDVRDINIGTGALDTGTGHCDNKATVVDGRHVQRPFTILSHSKINRTALPSVNTLVGDTVYCEA